jgi:cobalt-zinc-cadmium efflux system outer membrane protein
MSTMKYLISLFFSAVLGCIQAQSLDAYLVMAAENNPGLKAKYTEFEASLEKVAQVNALPDPTLSFGYFVSSVETRVGPQLAKFGLSQMFPWFGTLSAKGDVASFLAEAKYQEFINTRNELFLRVKSSWHPLFEVNRKIVLQNEYYELLESFKVLALSGVKGGQGSMVDVIRVDIQMEQTAVDIKLLEDQKIPLQVQFNKLLNREETQPIVVSETISIQSIESYYRKDSLLVNHPMLEAFDLKLKSSKAHEALAKKQGLPAFGVGIDYVVVGKTNMTVPDNGKDVLMPMVSMSLPIFRGKYNAAIKEAQLNQTAIFYSKEEFRNGLTSSYEMAWFELNKAKQLLELYSRQQEKTNQAITLLTVAYSNSGKDFEEILRMQQELVKYQIAESTAIKDYYIALAKIDYITAKTE